ncbi:MAG TPA: FAD-binding protein [Blastocatellia bacterium]|nr:FAD-binding protein [Blastocatellia bacterium]
MDARHLNNTENQTPPRRRRRLRLLTRIVAIAVTAFALWFIAKTWSVVRAPVIPQAPPLVINDVSQLNPIHVAEVITPTTTAEIVEAVRRHTGPISIGGARHSMGGQTATDGALFIDMRQFDRILSFAPAEKTITVQAGIRWRQIQEHIDPANLSVKIMQSYANFTVGGSLSVNAHGRYVGLGPIILSVRSLKVVLADGTVVEASPTSNADIFNGVIGGYGGLGVIVEATLELTDNVKVRRHTDTMAVTEYKRYFFEHIRDRPDAVFHNAEIYPPVYTMVRAVTYSITNDPVTIQDRLVPTGQSYRLDRFGLWVVSEWPLGKSLQQRIFDPTYFASEPVTWRNYEASLDTAELEPASRETFTYAIEEYFIPVDRFDDFVPRMRQILRKHDVNVVYVSIRNAKQDPGSLLAWARTEVFAFVVYYKQGTSDSAKEQVGVWTRELTDAALDLGGSYYLPYQLHATEEQFLRAYPRAGEFIALKQRLDPGNKFRNQLLDKYLYPR